MRTTESFLSAPVLMLSSGYEPLFRTNWKRALGAVLGGRAEIVETYKKLTIGTPSGPFPFPSIVRFTCGVFTAKFPVIYNRAQLSKKSLYVRDQGKCQYCHDSLAYNESTVDHVRPKSRGGLHAWNNVVLACQKCNQKKGANLLKEANVKLSKAPTAPSNNQLMRVRIKS